MQMKSPSYMLEPLHPQQMGVKAILSERAPITFPSWSLITTPMPATPSSWNMAPSKLALHQELGGVDQWAGAEGRCETKGVSWTC